MKKAILIFILFLSIIPAFSAALKAQDFNAEKAFADYQYQTSIYQKSYSDYQDARTFYKDNPTLQLREDARQKTLDMLKNRDQLVAAYLTSIRMQIVESTGFGSDEKGSIFAKIDPEVEWYKNHLNNYLPGDELNTLFSKSDESKNRYKTTTQLIIYEALFDLGLSQEIGLRLDHQQIYSDLNNYILTQVGMGKLKIDPFNRWLNDTDAVLLTLQKNEAAARAKIAPLYTKVFSANQIYTGSVDILASSIKPLSQLNNYLSEMLITIENYMQ